MFDKYCAPLLHLAGIKVAVVRTEHEGQARDLMALMEKTSAVVVAGGDGTLAEVCIYLLVLIYREQATLTGSSLIVTAEQTYFRIYSLFGLDDFPFQAILQVLGMRRGST